MPIAVIGVGCVMPGAPDVSTFWDNIVAGRDAISEVDPARWAVDAFDADRAAPDRSYSKVGGFVRDWRFDSRAFRLPPATARVMDRAQQYGLVAASQAFADAGLERKAFDRHRTAVILGVVAGRLEREEQVILRLQLPLLEQALHAAFDRHGIAASRREALAAAFREEYLRGLVEITEDTFAGLCPNVVAGRIANYFDLHGPNYVVDAACASSLGALDCAIEGLRHGDIDLAVCGGVHAHMGSSLFVAFSKFHALSTTHVSSFDESADGFVLGEGAGLFVLKRLDEAMRDSDRVLAVIRGIGSSSDGREKGIGAPNPRAQSLAIRRAMDDAGYSPGTVQFIEAHGAGTPVGDPVELEATHEVFGPHLSAGQRIAVSAVKSQIGHLMGAAGAAGLLKAVLGLHHKVMPGTINHTRPNPVIPWDALPFDVLTTARPWEANRDGLPRRANLSSFGFGGNNFHVALEEFDPRYHSDLPRPVTSPREPVAIVGMGACLPESPDVETFWRNVVDQVSAIVEIPADRWEGKADLFVDRDPDAPDKTLTRLGGFAASPQADLRRLRISPATQRQIDPGQKQWFKSALAAIETTQVLSSPDERGRTAVILGDSGGCRELLWTLMARLSARRAESTLLRMGGQPDLRFSGDEAAAVGARLVEEMSANRLPITEDSVIGISTSTGAARLAKGLDLMGAHMVVDAACASSLAAIAVAVQGLQARKWDAVVTGGIAGGLTPPLAVIASKAQAQSATGSRPFDENADGFVVGEGAVAFVLKRLSDAVAAGDRVYGVIRGFGASSNGRGNSMYAPDAAAQAVALSRGYARSGLSPASVQYVECHATSTSVGDTVELEALTEVFGERSPGSLALGSVKSQIGHTLAAAGAAGLLKTVLGLDRKTLPPMPAVARPLAPISGGRFRLVTGATPWPASADGEPRRAGVNAFGFGGTNWHVIVEEFAPTYHRALVDSYAVPALAAGAAIGTGAAEPLVASSLFVAAGVTSTDLRAAVGRLQPGRGQREGDGPRKVAFVAHSKPDLRAKVDLIGKHYRESARSPLLESNGIFATRGDEITAGPLVGLFPGQGPQYADMLRDLADEHEIVRQTIAEADEVLREVLGRTFAELMFTATRTPEDRASLEQSLAARSDIVQPVLVTAGVALHRLVAAYGVRFATLAGHSLGEYAALVAAGALDFGQALRVAHIRGQAFRTLAEHSGEAGAMATVAADATVVAAALGRVAGYVTVANRNCPSQTVVSGDQAAVRQLATALEAEGIECHVLPIAGAFHSRLAAAARGHMKEALAAVTVRAPSTRVLSSVDLEYYEPAVEYGDRVRTNLVEQLVTPVDFIGLVDRLHADGHRAFIEIGPKNALTGFVDDILSERPHRALFVNHPKVGEIPQLDRFIAQHALLDSRSPEKTVPSKRDRQRPSVVPGRQPERSTPLTGDRIWITGVSIGLPGRNSRVFSDDGLDRLLAGACFIEPVSEALQDRMVAKRVTRLVKSEDGEPYLAELTSRADAVKLAGQRGGFSLPDDFDVHDEGLVNADIGYQLAVAAGLECLRDARIPLQRRSKPTSSGGSLRGGLMLPAALQDDTAVVFASAYPGQNALVEELGRYYASTYGAMTAAAIRDQYLKRVQTARSEDERLHADQWFVDERRAASLDVAGGAYRFNRNFVSDYLCMGNTRFAQLVRARGPNMAVNAACCSTTVALGAAEDMIRCGRARRVIVLATDDVSSEVLFEWIGTGFLAAGAAATDGRVSDAAIPFDRRRHGMILGMGAVGFVVEAESAARERGLEPVAELLGVRCANSAAHMTRPDADHIVAEMKAFLEDMRARHAIDVRQLAANLVYGSHETFTPPSGGIAVVEGRMLKEVFGARWRDVLVVNTKCSTGHAQGAGLEDGIILKALQTGKVPPVLHSTEIDPELAGINLSAGGATEREYALRFSAGFGSQLAMSLTRVVTRAADRVTSKAQYKSWLEEVTEIPGAAVTVVKRVLQVTEEAPPTGTVRVASPAPARVAPRAASAEPIAPAPAAAAGFEPPVLTSPASASTSGAAADVTEQVLAIIEENTGYERRHLELDLDLEADLGIDTIKQAQVLARLREVFDLPKDKSIRVKDFSSLRHVVQYVQARLDERSPDRTDLRDTTVAVAPAAVQVDGPRPDRAAAPVLDTVLDIVEKLTGYERDALGSDLDLEADLGIDTIKQAQVMARVREAFDLPKDTKVRIKDFPTLGHVVRYVQANRQGSPVAATTEPATIEPATIGSPPDQQILDLVLGIIEKQTGYEREALGEDLDLEADLGIDTIKQVQVMARLLEQFDLPREQGIRVKDFPTIRHIVQYIAARRVGAAAATPPPPAQASATPASADVAPIVAREEERQPSGIGRMAVRWAACPIEAEQANATIGAGWTVLITDDALGVADALSRTLEQKGAVVEVLRHGSDLAAARARVGRVRALVLLHPLGIDPSVAALDASGWRDVLQRKVLVSFEALKTLHADLEIVAGVTAMSGPYEWRGQLVDPAGSGVAGLLKSFRHEVSALVKVIDVERPATRDEAAHVAAAVLTEVERGGTRIEVSYKDGMRLVPRVSREPLDLAGPVQRQIDHDSVIVAIGGTRGVTAAVVKELARRYRPRLMLVARRALPPDISDLAALDGDGLKRLKDTIASGWKARVRGVKSVDIERQYAAILGAIDAYRTIQACEAEGASVSYHECDVRDGDRLRDVIRSAVRRHGRVDGVIFGAGTIEDKLIQDKPRESFDRVFGIKAEGIFNLYKALDGVSLSFVAAFSSVVGRFGNRGQADYAAGNEVVARFVSLMQAARPATRCVAFDWTAWDEVGLAARSGVVELMKEVGFEALSPAEGARIFHEELIRGTGPEEIVIAGDNLPIDHDGQVIPSQDLGPRHSVSRPGASVFVGAVQRYVRGAWLSASATVELRTDGWLRDHVIDGAPLVPAVFGIEMMAEAATLVFPDLHLWGVRDLKLHRAVKVLKERPAMLKITASARSGDTDDERIVHVQIASDFIGPDGRILIPNRVHYTADVLFRSTPPAPAAGERRHRVPLVPRPPMPPIYGDNGSLPHGATFRVLDSVVGLDRSGIIAAVAPFDEHRVFPALNGHPLLTLPFAREAAFQAAGLWGILRHGHFGLPHGCRLLHTFGPLPPTTKLRVCVVPVSVDEERIEYDIDVIGDDGRLYDRMEGFYTINPVAASERIARLGNVEASA